MKTFWISVLLATAVTTITIAQTPDLPREVKIQFMENYISASNVQWQKDRQNCYLARFTHQSQNKLTTYTHQGSWLFTETSMVPCQLPTRLCETMLYNYNDTDILQVKRIETQNTITYRLTIKDKGEVEYNNRGARLARQPTTTTEP